MQTCVRCGALFDPYPRINGKKLNLHGRKRCLDCLALRHLAGPRKKVVRPLRMKTCALCGQEFPGRMVIDGVMRYLYRRRFCLACSPFGAHNTSASTPPGAFEPAQLREHRRRRRNAKNYRSQKKRRRSQKLRLIEALGGRCQDCGYTTHPNALEFHHLEASTKEFTVSLFITRRPFDAVLAEARKCVLLCANCHRVRHLVIDSASPTTPGVEARRAMKIRAIEMMGGHCVGCGVGAPAVLFEFHHRDASSKEFGIGEDGRVRSWLTIVAELSKCVMLCANCHREVHAGVRVLDEGPFRLAEAVTQYAA